MNIQKYTDETNRCHAFGKKDVRRCRLQRLPGQKTCGIHLKYYEDWAKKGRPEIWGSLSNRKKAEFIYQIKNRLVDVTETHIRLLHLYEIEYFDLYMKYTHHSPTLNLECLKSCINLYVHDKCSFPLKRSLEPGFCDSLEPFTKDLESTKFVAHFMSTCMIEKCINFPHINISNFHQAVINTYNPRLLPQLMKPEFRCLLYTNKLKKIMLDSKIMNKVRLQAPEFIEFYNLESLEDPQNPINVLIKIFNKVHGDYLKERCNSFKEELVQKVWHPRRVEKFLEMGYDICE